MREHRYLKKILLVTGTKKQKQNQKYQHQLETTEPEELLYISSNWCGEAKKGGRWV